MSDRQLLEVSAYETSDAFSELERLVLDYASRLSAETVDVPRELVEQLREHLAENQLVELTASIAWENFRARFNRGLAVPADGFSEGAVCALPAHRPHRAPAAQSTPPSA